MSDWDFADGVTVLGYFVIAMWLLGALFQISINIAHRCLPSVSARFLFVGGAIAALVLLALSLFYLLFHGGADAEDNNLRDFMVSMVCAEFGLFFLMLRGAVKAAAGGAWGTNRPTGGESSTAEGELRVAYISILNGEIRVPASDSSRTRFRELELPSYDEAVKQKKKYPRKATVEEEVEVRQGRRGNRVRRWRRRRRGNSEHGGNGDSDAESQGSSSAASSSTSSGLGAPPPPPFEQAVHL